MRRHQAVGYTAPCAQAKKYISGKEQEQVRVERGKVELLLRCCSEFKIQGLRLCTCSFFAFLRSKPFPIASAPPAPPRPPPVLRPPHPLPLTTFGRLPPESDRETPRALLLSTNGDLAPGAPQQSPPPNNLLARRCCFCCRCSCILPAVDPTAAGAGAAAHDDVDPAAAEERPPDLHLRPPSLAADDDDVAALEITADRLAVVAAGRRAAESGSRQQQEKA